MAPVDASGRRSSSPGRPVDLDATAEQIPDAIDKDPQMPIPLRRENRGVREEGENDACIRWSDHGACESRTGHRRSTNRHAAAHGTADTASALAHSQLAHGGHRRQGTTGSSHSSGEEDIQISI